MSDAFAKSTVIGSTTMRGFDEAGGTRREVATTATMRSTSVASTMIMDRAIPAHTTSGILRKA